MNPDSKVLKSTFLFSGVSTLGLIAAMALHEVGHILVVLYYGGWIRDLNLQPFSRSVVAYSVPASASQLGITAGGIVFSMIVGLLILLAARKLHSPYGLPVVMTGVAAFIGNGFYLIFGSILYGGFGDPARLLAFGFPVYFLVLWGIVIFVIGCISFLLTLPGLGINPEDSVGQRCVIIAGGVLPYLICVIIYNAIFDATRIHHYLSFIVGAFLILLLGAVLTKFLSSSINILQRSSSTICWKHAWFAVYLCMIVILIELFSF